MKFKSVTVFFTCLALITTSMVFAQEIVIDKPIATRATDDDIYKIVWHPSGQFLATATSSGFQLYDSGLRLVTQIHQDETVYAVSWSPDGSQIAVTNGGNIEIWDWNNQSQSLVLNTIMQGQQQQIAVEWSHGGTRLASLEMHRPFPDDTRVWDGTAHIWLTTPFASERTIKGLYSIEFDEGIPVTNRIDWSQNDDSTLVADWYGISDGPNPIVTSNSGIYFFDVETGDLTRTIEFQAGYSTAVEWNPSGTFFAVGDETGTLIFDSSTSELVANLGGDNVRNVDWSPDGRYVAGDSDINDFTNKKSLGYFKRMTGITANDWHPNGEWLATADYNGLLSIEDASLLPAFMSPP